MVAGIERDWNQQLIDQLIHYWEYHLQPGLEGLTDAEYFWEPAPGSWRIARRDDARTELVGGSGDWVMEAAFPEPDDPPLTTIGWRLGHVTVQVLGRRNWSHFGGPNCNYFEHEFAGTADQAIADLTTVYERWVDGVRGLGVDGLAKAVGQDEGPYAAEPFSSLVLHVAREVIHHGGEICLLRELHARTT